MPKCTIYMWGHEGSPSLVSPECIALYWYVNGYLSEKGNRHRTMEIVFANNPDLSFDGELPLLVSQEQRISGFIHIIKYLSREDQNTTSQLLQDSLLHFTKTELKGLTECELYLDDTNYRKFTQQEFCKLLYWPLWYNIPLHNRNITKKRYQNLFKDVVLDGNDDDGDDVVTENAAAQDLAQSSILKLKKRNRLAELQNVRNSMQYLSQLSSTLQTWIKVREQIGANDTAIPADLLMWANIYVQTSLPQGSSIKTELAKKLGTDFVKTLFKQLELCSQLPNKVSLREPTFVEQKNILMSVYNCCCKYLY